jgi:hypothetical protein
MDLRIGVTQSPREVAVELSDDTDREALKAQVEAALTGAVDVLWVTDKKNRQVAVSAAKIAYVEIGTPRASARSASAADLTASARPSLLDRHLLFVTGKGGVGKTTTAAALAELAASTGRRTLVCEMDAKGALANAFDVAALRFEPTELAERLWAMEMNTEDSLREYLRLFVRIPLVGRIGPLARTFDFVADAAPGVKEILAVGKLCYEVRERHYDLVVVDAEASGHIVAQIGAPRAIRQLVQVGLVRDQTNVDARHPRRPAADRSRDRHDARGDAGHRDPRARRPGAHETGVDLAAVVANRVLPALFSEREHEVFTRVAAGAARDVLVEQIGRPVGTVLDASACSRPGAAWVPPTSTGCAELAASSAADHDVPRAHRARAVHPGHRTSGGLADGAGDRGRDWSDGPSPEAAPTVQASTRSSPRRR